MVETTSQKSSEERKAMLEVEVHPDQAMNENREIYGPEGRGNRRLASESTPVEQGQGFATLTGTLDGEEIVTVAYFGLSDSSRKFIPEKQRKAMNDPFVERITRTRSDKWETVSGRMVETRSQNFSAERKAMLEVEVHPDQAMDENLERHGPEGRGNRRLAHI